MNKPEIVGYLGRRVGPFDATFYRCKSSAHPDDVSWLKPLIRLSDHEAERAADKARIAELEAALSINMPKLLDSLSEALEELELHGRHSDRGYQRLRAWYSEMRRVTRVVDAALSQQGKEGET